jgi:hypothetical protein
MLDGSEFFKSMVSNPTATNHMRLFHFNLNWFKFSIKFSFCHASCICLKRSAAMRGWPRHVECIDTEHFHQIRKLPWTGPLLVWTMTTSIHITYLRWDKWFWGDVIPDL